MELKIGKRYVTREGQVTGPLSISSLRNFPFRGKLGKLWGDWTENGSYDVNSLGTNMLDLVSEFIDWTTLSKEEATVVNKCSDEQVIERCNELIKAKRVNCCGATNEPYYSLNPTVSLALKKQESITLPNSGYHVVVIDGNLSIGSLTFPTKAVIEGLKKLVREGFTNHVLLDPYTLSATRDNLVYGGKYKITWVDAEVLLTFLEGLK